MLKTKNWPDHRHNPKTKKEEMTKGYPHEESWNSTAKHITKKQVPFPEPPKVVEFGNRTTVSVQVMENQFPVVFAEIMGWIAKDFAKVQNENFPDYKGFPTIKGPVPSNSNGLMEIGWWIAVPISQILEPGEEDLWDE